MLHHRVGSLFGGVRLVGYAEHAWCERMSKLKAAAIFLLSVNQKNARALLFLVSACRCLPCRYTVLNALKKCRPWNDKNVTHCAERKANS